MAIGVVQFVDIFLHSGVLQGSFLTVQISLLNCYVPTGSKFNCIFTLLTVCCWQ